MKKLIIVPIFFSVISLSSKACEICGCGVGNYYFGLLPQFNHKFIGLRYHWNSFRTRLKEDPSEFSKDFYQTVELWGGWNIGKRWQLLAFVPYNFNHQNSDDGIVNRNGFGDIALLANYKLLDLASPNHRNKLVKQQLWVGGGIKLPTGKFAIEENDPDVASVANGQTGSGSTDFLVAAAYNIQIDRLGINTNANYKINTTNDAEYRFGNKFSASSLVYYAISSSKHTISPNAGLMFQHSESNGLQSAKVDLTGGSLLEGVAGIEFGLSKLSFGFNARLPITQNFAEGQTKVKVKGMAHVTLAL